MCKKMILMPERRVFSFQFFFSLELFGVVEL